MGDKESIELEQELFKYHDTPFQSRCNVIINEISKCFKDLDFTNLYLEYYKYGTYNQKFVEYVIYNKLLTLDEYQRHDLNEMWAMLSDKNCWYIDYKIGQIVHEQLMMIWYPEDYKQQQ